MSRFEIETFNRYNLPKGAKTSTCPLCSHERKKNKEKCLMLDWETGLGTCQHCSEVIQLHTYKSSKQEKKSYKLPTPTRDYGLPEKVVDFFKGRGISPETLKKAKITAGKDWMPQYKAVVPTIHFNYYEDGILINRKYRGPKKSFKMESGAKLILSGIDRWKNSTELIITEGEIDELSWIQAGFPNVASVPNGASLGNINLDYLDNSYQYLENKEKIYINVDNDEAGKNLEKELVRRLGSDRCLIIDLESYKDANEAIISEGADYLVAVHENARYLPLENVITYQDVSDEYREFLRNGIKGGHKTGLEFFDRNFSTYTGQYIVITGTPSHGKSDFVDQMCLGYAFHEKMKVAYASIENKPNILHVNKLLAKMYGVFPSTSDLEKSYFIKCEHFLEDYFNFIEFEEKYTLEKVLEKARELVKRKGIKVLVIDPFNKITLADKRRNDDSYVPEYLQMIDEFCRKHDVLVLLVAHPVKMRKAPGQTQAPEPDMYDIRGTGDFYDMAYHGLSVYRDFERKIVKIKNLKVKFAHLGKTGEHCWAAWNPANGRYSELDRNPDDFDEFTPLYDNECIFKEKKEEYEKWQPIPYEGFDNEAGF